MTVTYVYCFSLLELSKSNKLIWYHSVCLWIHFSQKHLFFHNFLKKWRDFFTIFKRNDTIFHNWSGTGPFHNFGKKTLAWVSDCYVAHYVNQDNKLINRIWILKFRFGFPLQIYVKCWRQLWLLFSMYVIIQCQFIKIMGFFLQRCQFN